MSVQVRWTASIGRIGFHNDLATANINHWQMMGAWFISRQIIIIHYHATTHVIAPKQQDNVVLPCGQYVLK